MNCNRLSNLLALLMFTLLFSTLLAPLARAQAGKARRKQAASLSDPRLLKLPPELREQGKALLNEQDAKKRAVMARALGKEDADDTIEFLLTLLKTDPSGAVRREVIGRMGFSPLPQAKRALERCAAFDPDIQVALLALDKLRQWQVTALSRTLLRRLEAAKRSGDKTDERLLAEEQERWISLIHGTTLPAFLRTPPPIFSLKSADQPVRVLTLGDYGYGASTDRSVAGAPQRWVADAMAQAQRVQPFDFALTLGDNFYPDGMFSPSDARWRTLWQELYDPLGLKFYATLGNHDWHAADSPAAEILYSQTSPSWRLPSPYYTFTAGPVQFFALDTNEVSEAQLLWLKEALTASRSTWKLVYGHHPIYSGGEHGDNATLIEKLLPVLKGKADVYLAGHDHDMQHLKPEGGLHFFVNGAGGAGLRPSPPGERTIFSLSANGFATLEADAQKLEVKFFDTNLKQIYHDALTKAASAVRAGQQR
ncbi:MAG: metallophosphoesterase [Acidobacteriota bacterium]